MNGRPLLTRGYSIPVETRRQKKMLIRMPRTRSRKFKRLERKDKIRLLRIC